MVRIVMVDDHDVVRQGLKRLLESSHTDWIVVGEAADGDSALKVVEELRPDVLLTDCIHPGLDGIEIARWVSGHVEGVRVIIVTMHSSKQLVREILNAGAKGYVLTCDAGRDLVPAIEAVLDGRLFFTQTISPILLDGFLDRPQPMRTENLLTKREIEIIKLLAGGRSNKEVANELKISLRTAETHRANIMNKLQVYSLQELVEYVRKDQLIEPPAG